MILDMNPVAHIESVAIDRQRLPGEAADDDVRPRAVEPLEARKVSAPKDLAGFVGGGVPLAATLLVRLPVSSPAQLVAQ